MKETKKKRKKTLEQFFNILFGNNGKNLSVILSCDVLAELSSIGSILMNDSDVYLARLLIQHDNRINICKTLSEIVSGRKYSGDAFNINRHVTYILHTAQLAQASNMNTCFQQIYKYISSFTQIHYRIIYETNEAKQTEQINKFLKILFDNNGKNLETILSCCRIPEELSCIHRLLCEFCYKKTREYFLINLSKEERKELFQKLRCIFKDCTNIDNTINGEHINGIINEIEDEIQMTEFIQQTVLKTKNK